MIKKVSLALIALSLLPISWYVLTQGKPETISPSRGTVIQAVYATGEVEPVHWAKISTQITGKVDSIFVDEGDPVESNASLLQLDDTAECSKASQYAAKLRYLEKEKERYQALAENDYSSKSNYERILSEYEATQAQLDAQNEIVGRMLLSSPLDGIVLKRDVEPGETINPSDIVFWVGNTSPLRITAEVDEEDIALVKVGQTALIKADAFPDTEIEGVISDITPKGNPIDKNFRIRVSLPDDTPLLIGMTVEINIIAQKIENALLIPASSIAQNSVMVKEGRGFTTREVIVGISDDKQVQITEGLDETDIILLHNESVQTH
ncbi:MAG: efflux RND transporter periplasmic adaptor subunit [Rickettsiales bacterium]|nr:efflux RND transporter periplasmic adaptor subunit [Rickettsiales bacterium]